MIIQHPLAAKELGSFMYHVVFNGAEDGETPDWRTIFYYTDGYVVMSVRGNNYHYLSTTPTNQSPQL